MSQSLENTLPVEWHPYQGYEKSFCFIRLKDGSEHGPCWPNAGRFNIDAFAHTKRTPHRYVDEADVTHLRYATDAEHPLNRKE